MNETVLSIADDHPVNLEGQKSQRQKITLLQVNPRASLQLTTCVCSSTSTAARPTSLGTVPLPLNIEHSVIIGDTFSYCKHRLLRKHVLKYHECLPSKTTWVDLTSILRHLLQLEVFGIAVPARFREITCR